MKVFLDANVLFLACKSDGSMRRLLDRLLEAGHECWIDELVLAEARRNIKIKYKSQRAELTVLCARLRIALAKAPVMDVETHFLLPEKDRPVVAAAISLGCAALVTGDRTHFDKLDGTTVSGVTVHSPKSLVQSLLESR